MDGETARAKGKHVALRTGWSKMRLEIMYRLLQSKFQHSNDLTTRLMNTYPKTLIESNTWGDQFWGICRNYGDNHLGNMLMVLRHVYAQPRTQPPLRDILYPIDIADRSKADYLHVLRSKH